MASQEGLLPFKLIEDDSGEALTSFGEMPSAEAVRFFLYAFHDEKLLEQRPLEGAFIAEETEPLKGLWEVNREVVLKASRGDKPKVATIDQDATVVESHKEEIWWTELGGRGNLPGIT